MKFLALALLAPALAANVTVSPVACARDVINASKDVARASVQIASATNDCPLDDKTDCLADIDAEPDSCGQARTRMGFVSNPCRSELLRTAR